MKRGGYMYMMMNKNNTVIYTGVTSQLKKRAWDHKNKRYPDSFSARYNLDKLVYYEGFHRITDAIFREKQIKAGSRKKKEALIKSMNPGYNDLFEECPD